MACRFKVGDRVVYKNVKEPSSYDGDEGTVTRTEHVYGECFIYVEKDEYCYEHNWQFADPQNLRQLLSVLRNA